MSDELLVERDGPVLRVTFNRPAQRNALTWRMYADLANACEIADTDADVRVMVLRGAGDEAFVAGTDISQFTEFRTGEEGIAYEHKIGQVADRLANLPDGDDIVRTVYGSADFRLGVASFLAKQQPRWQCR